MIARPSKQAVPDLGSIGGCWSLSGTPRATFPLPRHAPRYTRHLAFKDTGACPFVVNFGPRHGGPVGLEEARRSRTENPLPVPRRTLVTGKRATLLWRRGSLPERLATNAPSRRVSGTRLLRGNACIGPSQRHWEEGWPVVRRESLSGRFRDRPPKTLAVVRVMRRPFDDGPCTLVVSLLSWGDRCTGSTEPHSTTAVLSGKPTVLIQTLDGSFPPPVQLRRSWYWAGCAGDSTTTTPVPAVSTPHTVFRVRGGALCWGGTGRFGFGPNAEGHCQFYIEKSEVGPRFLEKGSGRK